MIFGKKPKPQTTCSQTSTTTSATDRQSMENTRILSSLARDYLKEKKSRRRWGLFIKLLVLGYIIATTVAYFVTTDEIISREHTAVVELTGIIGADAVSASSINRSLTNAFAAESSVAVILKINSPGGTPVQAAQINAEIGRLKRLYPDKPVYAAITDICASGGYYIAVAADQIFAHPASIIGSIGVLMNGFGFVEAMDKLGVERRLITAGENKGILDPFSPVSLAHELHVKSVLNDVHQQFIDAVKQGRGARLKDDPELFSGLFWSGEKARKLGLIDQFGSAKQIAHEIIGAEKLVDYSYHPSFIDLFAQGIGASISNTIMGRALQIQ